jgi:hypothetical protein
MTAWYAALEAAAPDVVAAWLAAGSLRGLRRELRRRATAGSAAGILAQQEAIGDALADALDDMPEPALRAPGGEADWNVAQTFAHTTAARRFLAAWAALSAAGEWPADDPPRVRPDVPGPADAGRARLHELLEKSRASLRESARRIAGHETDRCPLDHPLIGRLRCGEWLLFVGVHDLTHLEQLRRLADAARSPADG